MREKEKKTIQNNPIMYSLHSVKPVCFFKKLFDVLGNRQEDYLPGMPNATYQGAKSRSYNTESDKLCKLVELSQEDCIIRIINVWWLRSIIYCLLLNKLQGVFLSLLCFEERGLIKGPKNFRLP